MHINLQRLGALNRRQTGKIWPVFLTLHSCLGTAENHMDQSKTIWQPAVGQARSAVNEFFNFNKSGNKYFLFYSACQ